MHFCHETDIFFGLERGRGEERPKLTQVHCNGEDRALPSFQCNSSHAQVQMRACIFLASCQLGALSLYPVEWWFPQLFMLQKTLHREDLIANSATSMDIVSHLSDFFFQHQLCYWQFPVRQLVSLGQIMKKNKLCSFLSLANPYSTPPDL